MRTLIVALIKWLPLGLLALWWQYFPALAQEADYAHLVDALCVKTNFQPDDINRQVLAIGGRETPETAAGVRTWQITHSGASQVRYIANTVPALGITTYLCNINFPAGNYESAIESLRRYFNPRQGAAAPVEGGRRVYKLSSNIFTPSFDQAASLTVNAFPAPAVNVIISANLISKAKP